jgi:hypothetical protein
MLPATTLSTVRGGAAGELPRCDNNLLAGTTEGAVGGTVTAGAAFAISRNPRVFLIPVATSAVGGLLAWATTPSCRSK